MRTLICILTAVLLFGCATPSSPTRTVAVDAAIRYATLKVIGAKLDRVPRVVRVVRTVRAALSDTDVPISVLDIALSDAIDPDALDPADAMLAQALISAVRAEVQSRLDQGLIKADARARLLHILDLIEGAAEAYR